MATQVTMPQLGESVVEGTVSKWLIQEGQPVKKDASLLAITTDKVDTEVPAPASGILLKIYVVEGQTVAKGTVLAEIGEQGAGGGDQESGNSEQETSTLSELLSSDHQSLATPIAQRMAAEHGVDLTVVRGTGPGGRITKEDVEAHLTAAETVVNPSGSNLQSPISNLNFISPAVARLATELGVDLTQVIGTGTGDRITKKDVLAYVAAPVPRDVEASQGSRSVTEELPPWGQQGAGFPPQPTEEALTAPRPPVSGPSPAGDLADVEISPLSVMQRVMARHMTLSVQTAPHVTTVMEADLTRVVQARARLRGEFERQGVRLTFTPFFVQAIVAGLKAVPTANSSFREDALLIHKLIHVGLAVAIPDGLIVPVIRNADEKSLLGLARTVNDLAERARTKRLNPDEVQGGTFTLTNHGTAGSLFATPIIVQPQAGILGIGAIQKRPVVISRGHPLLPDADDAIAIRPMAYLSFTFDHRILDGRGADGFLATVKRFLEGYSA